MNLTQIAQSRERFATKQIGEELVLVPIEKSVADMDRMFTLNEVGRFVWENLQEDSTTEKLLGAVLSEFDIDQETASTDLQQFLSQLETMVNE